MNDIASNDRNVGRKVLVPLVILLLISLTIGSAYAYTSTVTDTGAITARGDAVFLNMYDDPACQESCKEGSFEGVLDLRLTSVTVGDVTEWYTTGDDATVVKYLKAVGNLSDVDSIPVKAIVSGLDDFVISLKVNGVAVSTDGSETFDMVYGESQEMELSVIRLVDGYQPLHLDKITADYTISFVTTDKVSTSSSITS